MQHGQDGRNIYKKANKFWGAKLSLQLYCVGLFLYIFGRCAASLHILGILHLLPSIYYVIGNVPLNLSIWLMYPIDLPLRLQYLPCGLK
jgi:hypothetical protein